VRGDYDGSNGSTGVAKKADCWDTDALETIDAPGRSWVGFGTRSMRRVQSIGQGLGVTAALLRRPVGGCIRDVVDDVGGC
jgi:hypothetical protein